MADYNRQQSSADSLLSDIKQNWILIVVMVSFIIGYTNLQNKVAAVESKVQSLEAQQIETQKSLVSFGNDITYIKTTLDYIKTNLPRY